jgi:hypothetical protein
MKPNFALSLSVEGIGLLHRADGAGWHLVGEIAFDSADLAGDLDGLRRKAAAVDPAPLACKLILPEEQIKYLELAAEDAPADDLATLVANALDGATPYALDELAYDWVQTGTRVQVAAVARETLQEAEDFAREHRFNPVSFVARPDPDRFAGEPFFGAVSGGAEVERDAVPVTIIPHAALAEAPSLATKTAATALPAEMAAAMPESTPFKAENPLPAFSSIRAARAASLTEAAPPLAGAVRFSPSAESAAAPDLPRPGKAPPLNGAAAPVTRVAAPPPVGRAAPAPGRDAALRPDSPDDEAQRLTIFGARVAEPGRGKPRFLALILTAILLVFLIGVAAWAAIFTDSGLARLLRGPEPQIAITPDLPEPIRPVEDTAPLAAPPALTLPEPGPAPETLPETPPATDPLISETPATQPETEPAPVDDMTPEEALARYAATGIWQIAPIPPDVPDLTSLDDFYQTSIDEAVRFQDALALPAPSGLAQDTRPDIQSAPAPVGTLFTLDARGLVEATPEGALTPDGVRVLAGPPPLVPPDMPVRAVPVPGAEQTAADLAALQRLAEVRPRTRPGDLIEQGERGALAGRTRVELAALRPRSRPASVTAAAQATAADPDAVAAALAEAVATPAPEATPQAVAASLKPKVRPGILEQAAAPAATAPVARTAPADPLDDGEPELVAAVRAAPKIPSSASVARAATDSNAIKLREVNLIGVYGTPGNRRALVRLANGRYEKVKVGDRIDGGKVSAIGDSELRYNKRGRDVVLSMPKG